MNKLSLLFILTSIPYCYSHLFFRLLPNQQRCYIDELFDESVLMIKWKMYTNSTINITSTILPSVSIYVTKPSSTDRLFSHVPRTMKGKVPFTAAKGGMYKICIIYWTRYSPLTDPLYVSLRFASDNMDEPDIINAIQSKDISNFQKKTQEVLIHAGPIIDRKKKEIEQEKHNAEVTISTTKWYKYLTYGQIALCVFVGVIQVNNFRKFLKSQHII